MIITRIFKRIFLLAVLFLFLTFVSCGTEKPKTDLKKDAVVNLVYVDWAEGVALTYLAEALLVNELDYEINKKMTDVDDAFSLVATGSYDAFLDVWLPETHKEYYEKYKGELTDLGVNYENARTGLVVPEYLKINSIEELNGLASAKKIIYGIDTTAGIMDAAQNAIESYGLNFQLKNYSEKEMLQNLEKAYLQKDAVVVTGWIPHWMFTKYNLKFLEDPKNNFGNEETIHTVVRKGFTEDFPIVTKFLTRLKLNKSQLNTLMYEIQYSRTGPEEGVKNWIEKNQFVVNDWLRGFNVERYYSR